MHDRPRAHDAGLEGDVQRAAGQAIVAQGLGGGAQRHHLGVGGGVVTQDGLVEAAAGDATIGATISAPTGTSPQRPASWASAMASRMKAASCSGLKRVMGQKNITWKLDERF
jgi:hypothetical protein